MSSAFMAAIFYEIKIKKGIFINLIRHWVRDEMKLNSAICFGL